MSARPARYRTGRRTAARPASRRWSSGGRPTSLVYCEESVWLVSLYLHGPEVLAAARLFFANVAVGTGAAAWADADAVGVADAWAAGVAGFLLPVLAATSHTPPTTSSTAATAPMTWLRRS